MKSIGAIGNGGAVDETDDGDGPICPPLPTPEWDKCKNSECYSCGKLTYPAKSKKSQEHHLEAGVEIIPATADYLQMVRHDL